MNCIEKLVWPVTLTGHFWSKFNPLTFILHTRCLWWNIVLYNWLKTHIDKKLMICIRTVKKISFNQTGNKFFTVFYAVSRGYFLKTIMNTAIKPKWFQPVTNNMQLKQWILNFAS